VNVEAQPSEFERLQAKTWLGHPRGLTILFLTEMWSQFSFFGMRALLVYYMTKQLLFSQSYSSLVYGVYGALVYFTPLIGGVLSDRWLGRKRAVIIGASVMALGHFMMAFEALFYFALATITLGNGLFLPSLASQINQLYAPDDPRRATAYNVYYAGVNLGAFLAPFACGTIGEAYGWHWGFGIAGIGMAIGLVIYLAGGKYLPSGHDMAKPEAETREAPAAAPPRNLYLLMLAVIVIVVIFRAAYEQSGNTLALWLDTGVDRHVGQHFVIPMTWFQSLNPAMIVLFTLVIALWNMKRAWSSVARMALGGLIVGASYLLLAVIASGDARASWLWIVAYFSVYTLGELFILPVGLGLFGRLAPAGFAATAIAAWFMAAFFGNLAAGAVGALWSVLKPAPFFALVGGLAAVAGILLLALSRWGARIERAAEHKPAI